MPNSNQTNSSDQNSTSSVDSGSLNTPNNDTTNSAKNVVGRRLTKTVKHKKKENTIVINTFENENKDEEAIRANEIAITANNISWWSTRVNVGLLIVTVALAALAFFQYLSSQSAAQIAQKTLNVAIAYNKRTDSLKTIADKKTDSIDKEKFNRDTATFNLQIKALNETKNQFEIANEPVLEAGNFVLTFDKEQKVNISYDIFNFGKQYVFMKYYKSAYAVDITGNPTTKEVDSLLKTVKIRHLDGSIGYVPQKMMLSDTEKRFMDVDKYGTGTPIIIFIGEFFYFNPVTKTNKVYKCAFKIKKANEMSYESIFDINYKK